MKGFKSIFKKNNLYRLYSTSALYVTGDKAQQVFVPLKPFIDFDKYLLDKQLLKNNIELRKLDIDVDKLEKRYQFYLSLKERKTILSDSKVYINELYSQIIKEPDLDIDKINALKMHKHVISEELKSLKEYLYGLEENVMTSFLNLPNHLHCNTPTDGSKTIYEYLEKPSHSSSSHMELGDKKQLLEIVNSLVYFKNDLALYEIYLTNYVVNILINNKFTQFSNADFSRSIVVEGCGKEIVNNSDFITLCDPHSKFSDINRLHLTGGSSLYAFMVYLAKNIIQRSYFPLKLFCIGRSYQGNVKNCLDLFNLYQESTANIFIATIEDPIEHLNKLKDIIIEMYKNLGFHFKIVYIEASKIALNESCRMSIQMYSNFKQEYVEVGYISLYDDYISKRLLFLCNDNKKELFPKIISGNILNVQKLVGCILENHHKITDQIFQNLKTVF